MKAIKITLAVVLLAALFTSCTKQELNEDEMLGDPNTGLYIGGMGRD